jgi:hypothetical protein
MAAAGCGRGAKKGQKEASRKKPLSDNGASGDSAETFPLAFLGGGKGSRLASSLCWPFSLLDRFLERCLKEKKRSWRLMLRGSLGGRQGVDRFDHSWAWKKRVNKQEGIWGVVLVLVLGRFAAAEYGGKREKKRTERDDCSSSNRAKLDAEATQKARLTRGAKMICRLIRKRLTNHHKNAA